MKSLRFIGFALFTVLVSVSFSACGGSDDEDNGEEENTPSVSKRLVKVTTQMGEYTSCKEYTYDSNGRIIKVVNGGGYTIYTYTDNLIVKREYQQHFTPDNNGTLIPYETQKETQYELENGLIVKKTTVSKYKKYTYNNGYLATLLESKGELLYNFTWRDGNLMNMKRDSDPEKGDSYEYTSYATPANFFYLDYYHDYIDGELAQFYGKAPKNLPSKCINVYTSDGIVGDPLPQKETDVFSYDWTMKDGLPIKLIVTSKNGYMGCSKIIADFEWK